MKIGIANDHAATEMKFAVKKYLEDKGYEVVNYGTDSTDSYDYPIAGEALENTITSVTCLTTAATRSILSIPTTATWG